MIIFPKINLPIAKFYELANTLNACEFKDICMTFAQFDPLNSDDNYLRFSIADEVTLIVGIDDEKLSTAILSFCWWEKYKISDHEKAETYYSERKQYDEIFSQALETSMNTIGKPIVRGTDNDELAHNYAIWRGQSSLLILQQSAYDLQFGLDINFWIQPWSGADPQPTTPFIDWLFAVCR